MNGGETKWGLAFKPEGHSIECTIYKFNPVYLDSFISKSLLSNMP